MSPERLFSDQTKPPLTAPETCALPRRLERNGRYYGHRPRASTYPAGSHWLQRSAPAATVGGVVCLTRRHAWKNGRPAHVDPRRDDEKDGAGTQLGGHPRVHRAPQNLLRGSPPFMVPSHRGGKVAVLVVSLVWLITMSILDIATGASLAFTALLCVAPVIASTALDVRLTACIAAIATALSVPLGLMEGNLTTTQHDLDVAVVVIVSFLALWVCRLRAQLLQALEVTHRQATYDGLTGILNRRAIVEQGERFAVLRPDVRPLLCVVLIDIDRYKSINDTHGHLVGDEVLAGVADRLSKALRDGDLLGRYGGDEFLAVLVGGDHTTANAVAGRALDLMRKSPIATSNGPVDVTLSIGLSALAAAERDLAGALRRADGALYDSKRHGRARSTWRHSAERSDEPGFP